MKINLPNLTFQIGNVTFHAVQLTFEWMRGNIPMHAHGVGSYELHLISDGKGTLRTSNREYPLAPNSFFVTGPNVEHEQIIDGTSPMREYCIYLTTERTAATTCEIAEIFLENAFWLGEGSRVFEPMKRCFEELTDSNLGQIEFAITYLRQIVLQTARSEAVAPTFEHSERNFLENIFLRVEEAFLYRFAAVTLEDLAEEIGFSPRQTQRILKKHYGRTFREMRDEARLSQAKRWLEDGILSVTEISEKIGYSSLEHFSYAFKKRFGVSPLKWKKYELTKAFYAEKSETV